MLLRQEPFTNGEIYHIVNRGIDDNLIFQDENDYYRGIFSIYEFNTANLIKIRERRRQRENFKKASTGKTGEIAIEPDKREMLVEVLAFCLMPNHFHLLLQQIRDGGITNFMRKVGTGYSGYFNRKYERKGHVFQNKFTDVHIKGDNQLKNVFVYIHTNPIAIIESKWKEGGVKELSKAKDFIENYKWSSYPDYLGNKNFPSVTQRDFILEVMGGENGCKNFVDSWVENKAEILA
ncbi:MAG: transposase [Candidatus Pacebacteria bacterium]|nr:transposase [Candidatus Paceibacterota bacterium]